MAKDDYRTPDQVRAQEKREAGQARADAAAKESLKQEWPPADGVVEDGDVADSMKGSYARSAPPKGRKGSNKSEG